MNPERTLYNLLSLLSACGSTYVTTRLWTWFMVPLGVAQIGFWHAFGLNLLWALFAYHYTPYKEPTAEDAKFRFLQHLGLWLSIWLLGWLAQFGL